MIKSFFQSLERGGVAYLLISGQATVLYGAAAFSEDVDLWIKPTQANIDAFLATMESLGARYYKLTPPLTVAHMRRGHGFHFTVPDDPEFFLDVMGKPPRVRGFDEAAGSARIMKTGWGRVRTIGIKHLVALKMTQRLGDYPVIGQLALRHLTETATPSRRDYEWAVEHTFTIEDLEDLLSTHPAAARACDGQPALRTFAAQLQHRGRIARTTLGLVERLLTDKMLRSRRTDRAYWSEIIADLADMRRDGKLMPVGQPVTARAAHRNNSRDGILTSGRHPQARRRAGCAPSLTMSGR